MHRIDTPTAQKDKFGAGKNGFTRGNPQTGTPATDLDDDYFDMLQEELAGVVEATGVNLDKTKNNQLLTALKALLLSRAHPFADIKSDGAEAIAEALSNLGLGEAAKRGVGTGANQLPDMSSFAALLSTPGYQRLPGGLVIQWGISPTITSSAVSIIYPIPFPTRRLAIIGSPLGSSGGDPGIPVFTPGSVSSCSMNTWGSNNYTATWIAIGN